MVGDCAAGTGAAAAAAAGAGAGAAAAPPPPPTGTGSAPTLGLAGACAGYNLVLFLYIISFRFQASELRFDCKLSERPAQAKIPHYATVGAPGLPALLGRHI